MLIDREHYLQLLHKNELLAEQNLILKTENQILARELQQQKTTNYQLNAEFRQIEEYALSLNQKIIHQNESLHQDLKGHTAVLHQKQTRFLEEKFKELQSSSFSKYKLLELRHAAKRIENHDLTTFCEKVKKIYRTAHKNEKQPSFKDMLKWIKDLKPKKTQEGAQTNKPRQAETNVTWNPRP